MSTRRHPVQALSALAVLLVVTSAAAQQAATKIAPRDQLAVSVWNAGVNEASYSGKFPVDIDGTFEYPTVGRVKAAGLTAREVEADLTTRLGKYLVSPQVTVEVEQSSTRRVIMAGEVKMPASYSFAGELTLFEALTRAGALTELGHTLDRAVPVGYARLFLDEGPAMESLLRELAARPGTSAGSHAARLVAMLTRPTSPASVPTSAVPLPAEALSERELDVLRLLATELTGPEIARRLFVSVNTLRTHTKHIFTKLDVNTRQGAVRRAAELGLL